MPAIQTRTSAVKVGARLRTRVAQTMTKTIGEMILALQLELDSYTTALPTLERGLATYLLRDELEEISLDLYRNGDLVQRLTLKIEYGFETEEDDPSCRLEQDIHRLLARPVPPDVDQYRFRFKCTVGAPLLPNLRRRRRESLSRFARRDLGTLLKSSGLEVELIVHELAG